MTKAQPTKRSSEAGALPQAGADAFTAESAPDAVFFGIVTALETRRLVPGQRLVEADLAASYAVGRNSVREALQRLAAEGLVELVRNRGAVIRLMSRQEVLDVLAVAERISGLLARSAARAVSQGASARPLLDAIALLTGAVQKRDDERSAQARRLYYRALLELAASRELRRLVPVIQMPIVHAQHPLPALAAMRLRDYGQIAQAVARGDEDEADQRAAGHVAHVRQAIVDG